MNVQELIKELYKQDPHAEVLLGNSFLCPITDVSSFVCEDNGVEYVKINHSGISKIVVKRL